MLHYFGIDLKHYWAKCGPPFENFKKGELEEKISGGVNQKGEDIQKERGNPI